MRISISKMDKTLHNMFLVIMFFLSSWLLSISLAHLRLLGLLAACKMIVLDSSMYYLLLFSVFRKLIVCFVSVGLSSNTQLFQSLLLLLLLFYHFCSFLSVCLCYNGLSPFLSFASSASSASICISLEITANTKTEWSL